MSFIFSLCCVQSLLLVSVTSVDEFLWQLLQSGAGGQQLPIRLGLVKFSARKPTYLPRVSASTFLLNGTNDQQLLRRQKRVSHFSPEVAQDVCPSVSDWVARSEAFDPYGNRLQVLQMIPVNGTVVNQYFFETFCVTTTKFTRRAECRGINKDVWNSRCKENYIWTYGKVLTLSGDLGWSVIAIRGSCGCAIWRKPEEIIGRRRRLQLPSSRNIS